MNLENGLSCVAGPTKATGATTGDGAVTGASRTGALWRRTE
jgi:hypothetical protein